MKRTLLVIAVLLLAGGAAQASFFDIWMDGFESGLTNWTSQNPSGDGSTVFGAVGAWTTGQGTVSPVAGQQMARVNKGNAGLAYLISNPIAVVPGAQVQVSVWVAGLGDFDNCGFRWNKFGYAIDGAITWVGDNFRNVGFERKIYSFAATGSSVEVVLGLDRACRDGLGHSALFDEVVVSTDRLVPEPGSLLALVSGLAGLGAIVLRKR